MSGHGLRSRYVSSLACTSLIGRRELDSLVLSIDMFGCWPRAITDGIERRYLHGVLVMVRYASWLVRVETY